MKVQFDYESFRAYMHIWRVKHNLSIRDMAKALGLSTRTIGDLFEGHVVKIETLILVCGVLEVDPRTLFIER